MSMRGFTILELLLSMGIIALLAAIVIVAINPTRQLAQARNATRQSDVQQILKAVQQYAVQNQSSYPPTLDGAVDTLMMIGADGSGCDVNCGGSTPIAACLDLSAALVPEYLAGLPQDPLIGTSAKTYYAIKLTADRRIHVRACAPDLGTSVIAEQ